jgi:hypothetical protein
MPGWEAGRCCQILAYAGLWLAVLCDMLQVNDLRACKYVSPGERQLFDLMHACCLENSDTFASQQAHRNPSSAFGTLDSSHAQLL